MMFAEYSPDGIQGVIQLSLGMCSHQRETDQGVVGRHGGRHDRIHKDALIKQFLHDKESQIIVPDEQRNDWG